MRNGLTMLCALYFLMVATGSTPATADALVTEWKGTPSQISARIHGILNNGGDQLSYDELLEIHGLVKAAAEPIPDMEALLRRMIKQRNTNPRVDQMILIFTARAIGETRFPIPNVAGLFDGLMAQESRINEWVLSFFADALARYPVDLPEGPRLVTDLESLHRRVRRRYDPTGEIFGFHFLPPPKTETVSRYLDGIQDQTLREVERNRYYVLIERGITEQSVAVSLKYLERRRIAAGDPICAPAMKCLLQYQDKMPFGVSSDLPTLNGRPSRPSSLNRDSGTDLPD
jgi:hypothetical protein